METSNKCSENESLGTQSELFDKMPWMDAKHGSSDKSSSLFDTILQRDVTLWNAIAEYAPNGFVENAL